MKCCLPECFRAGCNQTVKWCSAIGASLHSPPVMCEMLECVSRSPGTSGNDQILIKTLYTLYQSYRAHWGPAQAEHITCFEKREKENVD